MKRFLLAAFLCAAAFAQNTAKFPGAVPTTADLGVAANRAATTLTAGITSSATSIPVASSSGFKAGSFATIDNEILAVCSIPDGTHLNVGVSACPNADGRGVDTANGGGAAASHLVNAAVQARIVASNLNQPAAEIIAIATKLHSQVVNVKDYGAKCDGSTNDTTAFAAAIAAAAAMGNPTIHFPAGVCVGNLTLGSGESIQGASVSTSSYCAASDTCPTVIKDATSGASPVIAIANAASGVGIKDLELAGTGSGTGDRGIYAPNATAVNIENVGGHNFGHEFIRWEGGIAMRISHAFAEDSLLVRQTGAYSGAVYFGGTDGFILDSEFTASVSTHEAHSLSSNCYNTGLYVGGANHFILNTYGETSEIGIYVAGTQNRIANSRADLNYCQGAVIAGGGNLLTNFLSLRNGLDGNGTWEGVKVTGSNNTIAASAVDQSSSVTPTYGFTDATAGDTVYNTFTGNQIIGTTQPLYSFASAKGAAFTLTDKDAITIADGTSTPTLSAHTLYQFGQTTPITISTVNGGIPGQRACFFGNTNVTLSSAGNLYLGGASTETMVANRLYCFRDVSNFWYVENTLRNPIFGTITATQVDMDYWVGTRLAPTPVAGAALGIGGTATASGTAFAGYVQLNTGGSGTGAGTAVTLTFPGTYPYGFKCAFSPANAQGVDGVTKLYWPVSSGTGNAVVTVTATSALPTGEALGFNYVCGL